MLTLRRELQRLLDLVGGQETPTSPAEQKQLAEELANTRKGIRVNTLHDVVPAATAMRMFNRTSVFRILVQMPSPGDLDQERRVVDLGVGDRDAELDVSAASPAPGPHQDELPLGEDLVQPHRIPNQGARKLLIDVVGEFKPRIVRMAND